MAPLFDPKEKQISVAFVCLGNICRSPMAEAIFKHKVQQLGYSSYFKNIESFGTSGWHIGESPDSRSSRTCRKHGVPVNHSAQQISSKDFDRFDYVIGMDESNLSDLKYMQPKSSKDKGTQVELFGKWRSNMEFDKIVGDPYYGGNDGFEYNFKQINHFAEEFLKQEVGTLD
ncbi:low molecular weight phosphotyrosine protein phosphatase [Lodderomyces elongisporus NRRL YB-4239]|uniref:Low molecular weight phosphotyrosine protein phosphatase n=1 Tax=Lodderomyces elongisporus (strain ATCC 11503 / CBS 2605 / JCM 1781 / NBRC 1676 / NRRL YB-4239) TaxID=379508 RepID=A5DSP1_LODEL|nr:low molecular weight phosphotyrosine protein phosphatase [Lodderomyces elongisporus NRRL YB-4239]